MFIWDFVAAKVLGQIVDWFYSQIVGFLGNFFAEMGNMGAELFTMDWVQSIVDRKSTRLNSSHLKLSRMPSSA